MLREVHERVYGNHLGDRSLIHKVVRAGYYWPTIQADTKAYVKVYDQCQRFNNIPRQPLEYLTPMMALWPFAQWGLDILGPFPVGTKQMKFLVVGIDYFTKWVEAEPFASITQQNVKNFVWKKIVCAGLGCLEYQCLTTDDNLTKHFSKIFVNTLGFKIIIPHQPTFKQTVKLKLQIDPC